MVKEDKAPSPGFAKAKGGKMYFVEEVDAYIEMLRTVYNSLCIDEENCKRQLKQEREISFSEKQKLENELEVKNLEVARLSENLEKIRREQEVSIKEQLETMQAQEEKIKEMEVHTSRLQSFGKAKDTEYQNMHNQLASYQNRVLELERKLKEKEAEKVISSNPRTEEIISLVERANEMTEAYVRDIEAEMDSRNRKSKEDADKLMHEAKEQALLLIQDAREKAKDSEEEASARVSQILSAGKEELREIRSLINKNTIDYLKITEQNLVSEIVFEQSR